MVKCISASLGPDLFVIISIVWKAKAEGVQLTSTRLECVAVEHMSEVLPLRSLPHISV
jgi:hypothetical protein